MQEIDPRFPERIRPLWASLNGEVVWLHARWIIYRQLYGTSAERVELLNQSAGSFFHHLQDILLHNVQLGLAKLSDPATSGRQHNLSLDALHQGLVDIGEHSAATILKTSISSFKEACKAVRQRRNKWIAHLARDTMLKRDVTPLIGPARSEIEAALATLRESMNCVSLFFANTTTAYEYFGMQADGEALMRDLRRAARYKELVEEGTIPRSDYRIRFKGEK